MPDLLEEFVADEDPAIDELRLFAGGELKKTLDGSRESLQTLDEFFQNLTKDPNWASSPLFDGISSDMRTWLAVRIAYFLGLCLRRQFGSEWYMSDHQSSPVCGTPVMAVGDIEVSPLEIAAAYLAGDVEGGLVGLVTDLEDEIRTGMSNY